MGCYLLLWAILFGCHPVRGPASPTAGGSDAELIRRLFVAHSACAEDVHVEGLRTNSNPAAIVLWRVHGCSKEALYLPDAHTGPLLLDSEHSRLRALDTGRRCELIDVALLTYAAEAGGQYWATQRALRTEWHQPWSDQAADPWAGRLAEGLTDSLGKLAYGDYLYSSTVPLDRVTVRWVAIDEKMVELCARVQDTDGVPMVYECIKYFRQDSTYSSTSICRL